MNHRHVEPFPIDFRATVVAYAEAHTNAAAAEKFGVNRQSVGHWRNPLRSASHQRALQRAQRFTPIRGYCGICDRPVIYGNVDQRGTARRGSSGGEIFDIETSGRGAYITQPDGRYKRIRGRVDGLRTHRCRQVEPW